jgi:hypothetical protein
MPPPPPGGGAPILRPQISPYAVNGFVVTRLHARYSKDALGDDLFFRAAPPIVGGREFVQSEGKLEQGARPDSQNNFQARYAIRHPWTGPIACAHPQRGVWGGPPARLAMAVGAGVPTSAKRLGLAPRDASLQLAAFVKGPLPPESMLSTGGATPVLSFPPPNMAADAGGDLGAVVAEAGAVDTSGDAGQPPPLPPTAPPSGGCAGCSSTQGNATTGGAIAALLGIALTRLRRRRG